MYLRLLLASPIVLAAPAALADRGELRLSAAASLPTFAETSQAGGSGSSAVWGGRLRVAQGLSDWLELGGTVGFSSAENVRFKNATVRGLQGDLYGDLYGIEAGPTLRFLAPKLFAHGSSLLRPLVDLRGGAFWRVLASQLAEDPMQREIDRPPTDTSVSGFFGVTGGVEYRFADSYAIGMGVDYMYAGDRYYGLGVTLELSWLRL
jgi:hypothetical protein